MNVVDLNKPVTAEQLRTVDIHLLRDEVRRRILNQSYGFAGSDKDFAYGPDENALLNEHEVINASAIWKRGNKAEALHQLEHATAGLFPGLGDLKLQGQP